MIVCNNCGHENGNDDAFCKSCGAFLEWEGKPAPTGMLPKATKGGAPAGGDAGAGTAPRRQATPPAGGTGTPPAGGSSRPAGRPPAGRPQGGGSPPAAGDGGEGTQLFDAAAEARRADGAPPPARPDGGKAEQAERMLAHPSKRRAQGQPEAKKPQEVQEQVDYGKAPDHGPVVEPGQVACQNCGWGNDPGRHFCRHCGATLQRQPPRPQPAELTQVVPRRGGGDRALRLVLATLGAAAVLGAAALLALSLHRGAGGGGSGGAGRAGGTGVTRAGGGGLAAVPADALRVAASSQSGEHVATNLIDGDPGTFWSRRVTDGIATLTFTFDRPRRLARISIAAGASGDEFPLRHRPRVIRLQFSDGAAKSVTLADQPGFQNVDLEPRTVDRVRIAIVEVYQAASGPNRRLTAISEVRFFTAR
ncbi:MAG TPA: discoidin domain-containing protein [Actinomycetes bacterium]